jgi:purine nucleosidase
MSSSNKEVSLVLDTDIGSDVDDAIALAFAMRHPRIDLQAVTTVSGDTALRARLARKLLELAGQSTVPVGAGVASPTGPGSRAWFGHEGVGVIDEDEDASPPADGVALLVDHAGAASDLATIGPLSNVAAAHDRDPSWFEHVTSMATMAGCLAPAPGDALIMPEHNASVDPRSTVRALNAGIPTLLVPFDVTVRCVWRERELEALRGGDDLCRALARLIEVWIPVLRSFHSADPPDVVAGLHDPLTIAAIAEPRFVEVERIRIRLEEVADGLLTVSDPDGDIELDAVRDADVDAFSQFLLETIAG